MDIPETSGFGTRAIHSGQTPDSSTGAIMTPIYQTSTYVQDGPGVHKGYQYSRSKNPTRTALEDNIAGIEGAKFGLCFASGCAATTNIALCLSKGDHVVCGDDLYGGTFRLFDSVFTRMGIEFSYVDMSAPAKTEKAIQANTKMLWIETPTNPMLKLIDIEANCAIAKKRGVTTVVDNTFATPYLQTPLALGADIVVHSTTKYLGGHSDVVGGAIATNDLEWRDRLAFVQNSAGGICGPFDAFLVLRGIKTLHVRMDRHVSNAKAIAQYLEGHENVEKVYYPGLKSHPQYELCKKQMKAPGGMISFLVKGGLPKASSLLKKVRVFACAESLGGVESLIGHPVTMTHASIPVETRQKLGIDDGLIRISVGIEEIDDLLADIKQALE